MVTNKDKPLTTKKGLRCMLRLYFSRSKSSVVSLMLITAYLLWFTLGLLFGGGFTNTIDADVSHITGFIATITVFGVGSYLIYESIFRHHPVIILTIIALMGANIAHMMGLFELPVEGFLFDIATFFTMIAGLCLIKGKKCLHIGHRK